MKAFLIPPRLLWVPPCSVTYYRYVYECVSTHPQVYICMKASGWQKISFSNTVLRLVFVYSLSLKLELIHLGRLIGQEALGIHLLLSSRRVTTTYHCDLLYMDVRNTNSGLNVCTNTWPTESLCQHTYYSLDLSKSYIHFQTPVLILNESNLLPAF